MSYSQQPPAYPYQQSPYPQQAWDPKSPPPSATSWKPLNGYPQQQQQGYPQQGYPQQGYAPPPQGYYPPQQALPQQGYYPPPQQQRPVFRWTTPASGVLNSQVHDPSGRTAYTISTPKKKETKITNAEGQELAKIEWSSNPTISLGGAKEVKIRDWIPLDAQSNRTLNVNGDHFVLAEENATVVVYKNGANNVGLLSDPNDILQVELSPEVTSLLDEFVIIATILQSGYPIEKKGWLDGDAFKWGMIGGTGGAVATAMGNN